MAITARGPPVTHSATQGGDFVDTDLIPFGLTTEGILLADACLRETIVTPGLRMGGAAARTRTGSAIVGAGEAALVLGALAIAAAATVTTAAAEFCHLFNADTIPGEFAAEGVLGTDAGLEGGVVAPRRILGLTTATGAPTRAAILGADLAILSRITTAVPALWPGTVATATPHALHFSGTDAIPFGLAAIGVVSADAAFHRGVVASRRAVVSAAVAIAAAPATVIRTRCAILVHRTDAVATGLAPATVSPIPGAGTVAVADVVVGPVTRVAGLAAGAGARIAGAEITASSALATAQVAHLVHADVVPLGFTAEGIVGTDAGGDGRIEASRRAVGRTTIAVTGTTAAILGAEATALVRVAATVAAERPAPAAIPRIPRAGAVAVTDVVVVPPAAVGQGAAGTGATVSGAEVAAATALAAAEFIDLAGADVVPFGLAAVGILGTDAGRDPRVVASGGAVVRATVAAAPAGATIVGTGATGLVIVAHAIAAETAATTVRIIP